MDSVAARIESRRRAEAAWDLVNEEHLASPDPSAYWERIVEMLRRDEDFVPKSELKPMNDAEVRAFEAVVIPFGLHKGERVDCVPFSYLCHLSDPSPFLSDVKRYLRNQNVKRQIEEEV